MHVEITDSYSNFTFGDISKIFTTEEGRQRRQDKRDVKANTSESEAELNRALAAAAEKNDSGMSTGMVVGLVVLGLAAAIATVIIIKKRNG